MKMSCSDNIEAFQRASPLFRINPDAPPFLIIHGDKDSMIPFTEGRAFAEKLEQTSSNPVAYAQISGGQHAFDMLPSIRSEYVIQGVEKYLGWLYTRCIRQKSKDKPPNIV